MRAPELGDECRPGGSCPTCNAKPSYCQHCLEVTVEDGEEFCDACKELLAEDEEPTP
jgi:hypothetical protein